MMDIGDDKELMAEFAEFKELLSRDLRQTAASAAPPVRGLERATKTAAVDQGPSPQAPRAEESWSALHATEEEFLSEPEEELDGAGRRALFYAAAAIVIVGLAALTWVLGPWGGVAPSEDPALATAPPLAAPEVLDTAATQSQDATPVEGAAKPSALEESAKAPTEPAAEAVPATAAAVAPASESQSHATAAASPAPTATDPAVAPLGATIPVPAGAAAAPQLAPLPTAPTASASTPARVEPATPPVAAAPSKAIEPPQTAAPAKPALASRQAAAPAAPVSEPPTAAAEPVEAPKPAPRAKVAKPKKPAKPIASRPKPAPAEPVAVASPEPVAPPPPPAPASDGPLGFVKKSVNAVGSAIGGFVR